MMMTGMEIGLKKIYCPKQTMTLSLTITYHHTETYMNHIPNVSSFKQLLRIGLNGRYIELYQKLKFTAYYRPKILAGRIARYPASKGTNVFFLIVSLYFDTYLRMGGGVSKGAIFSSY